MSSTEQAILDFVIAYKESHGGTSPSYEEIMEGCNISSKSTVGYHLDNLEQQKKIKVVGVRNIQIPGEEWTVFRRRII